MADTSQLVVEAAGMARDIHRVLLEHVEWHDVQRSLVGRREDHVSGSAIAVGAQPVHGRDAPAITGHQAGKLIGRDWRAQVVADAPLMVEKLSGDHSADGVAAEILWSGPAAAITVETGQRVAPAGLQLASEHIAIGHLSSIRAWLAARQGRVFVAPRAARLDLTV
jgi:hypothetical protein